MQLKTKHTHLKQTNNFASFGRNNLWETNKEIRSQENWPSTAGICERIEDASSNTATPIIIQPHLRTSQHTSHELCKVQMLTQVIISPILFNLPHFPVTIPG